jgi:hypothetical protein
MSNKRIIKTEMNYKDSFKNKQFNKEISQIQPDNQTLHPISTQWINTQNIVNPICLTKFQILNNETKILNNYQCKTNGTNYKSFLFVPPIGLESNDILQIYQIESIDQLYSWINENISEKSYFTIIRVVNCWIRVNFETLKNYNNFLVKIISKMFKYNLGNLADISELDKEIKDYINYWMNKNNGTEFKLNLVDDFANYIIKKYKIKSKSN